jgi:hypothetical protein
MSEPILSHTFKFPDLKPFSVNASYVRTYSGVTKSSGAREFSAQVFNIISRDIEAAKLSELRSKFDPKEHCYKVQITAYYPESEYYTKKHEMSSKTLDITNFEKILVDCLFLPKFNDEPFPYGAPNLNCDDRYLAEMASRKLGANKRLLEITISVHQKPAVICLE